MDGGRTQPFIYIDRYRYILLSEALYDSFLPTIVLDTIFIFLIFVDETETIKEEL